MSEDMILILAQDAMKTAIYIAGPMLMTAMVIGIVVSVFQAITQINEATLTFIPKILGVMLVLFVLAPWMLETLQTFAADVIGNAGERIR